PTGISHIKNIDKKLETIEKFTISINITQNEPTIIIKKPLITLDLNKNNKTTETVLINKDKIIYNKYLLFGVKEINLNYYSNFIENKSNIKKLLLTIFIFLIPSITFYLFIYFATKYTIIIIVSSILAWIITRFTKQEIKFKNIIKTAIYSTTIMIIFDIIFLPLYFFFILPIIIYLIFFIMGIWFVSEKDFKMKHKESKIDDN
ncbi:MAG: DUF1189 family protein, partial [Candidatus Woesearchaeota archaeon]